jgi:hypothetical protein
VLDKGDENLMKVEHMIPNIYAQSFDMRIVARLIDAEAEILRYYTEHILDCYSPEHCPPNLLETFAEHLGFAYQELKTVMYNRIVLKNFIKNMIRYRGSATGIRNAAAIDIRYRQTYPQYYFDPESARQGQPWVENPDYGQQIPMNYHESIDIDKTWLDADIEAGIIYLFVIASDYFPKITSDMTAEEKKANYEERMRRLLDLAYLQEYVRPVGMYLLPMVARKVDPHTDITVKAVRVPEYERTHRNGVEGTPNASMEHEYDRMLFAKVENPDDELSVEPWVRTLYHSQLAGTLNHEYYTKPVYHIEGKFLYYDHDELMHIYSEIQQNVSGMAGMKIGDSLYNPNIIRPEGSYSYGPEQSDEAEPLSLQQRGVALETSENLRYDDHVGFPKPRVYQNADTIAYPIITDASEPYPVYLDANRISDYTIRYLETTDLIPLVTQDGRLLGVPQNMSNYLINSYVGTHVPTLDTPGDGDDGTNKNLMINLFQVDEHNESKWTGAYDVQIAGKGPVPRQPVPYDPATNGPPTGDDVHWSVKNSEGEDNPDDIIP